MIKAIVLIALVSFTFALKPRPVSLAQQKRITEIRQGNSWAGIVLNLAQLSMQAQGPVEDLLQALHDVVADLAVKQEKATAAYNKRTAQHVATVKHLNQQIANTVAEIARIDSVLELLAQQKADLLADNVQQTANIADDQAALASAATARAAEAAAYAAQVEEAAAAVAVIDNCLEVVHGLQSIGSFVQVKQAKVVLTDTMKKVKALKTVDVAFLAALVQVAVSQDFADKEAVGQVEQLFNDIKAQIQEKAAQAEAAETGAIAAYNAYVAQTNSHIAQCQTQIASNNEALAANAANTETNEGLKAARQQDKADFEEDLVEENAAYDAYVIEYNAYIEENNRESAVCGEALDVLGTLNIAEYIKSRVDAKDGLVSSGMATTAQHSF